MDIKEAKELIAKVEKENLDKATEILKKANEEINELGFVILPRGEFVGNNLKTSIVLASKK